MSAKETLLQYFENETLSGKTFTEIAKFLKVSHREKKSLLALLDSLCDEGALYVTGGGKYGTPEQLGLIKGTLSGNERGFAFLVPENKALYGDDFFIPHKNLHGALHGDTVYAERVYGRSDDEAEVVRIVERGYTEIVGTFWKDKNAGCLHPDEKKYFEDIYIPLSKCFNIPDGVKAVARITEYPFGRAPGGEIVEVLGEGDDFFAEELSIIRSYKLREEFPEGIEAEAERQAAKKPSQAEIENRRDFREKLIVTIDGEDTRDIDDAVSLEKDGELYVLGVHIADVSHYVKYRSPLDKEAFARGTSVYFPDRVLPMLPRALSNGICSLNEGEDRLAFSCLMRLDENGEIRSYKFVKSVICSRVKGVYKEINALLEPEEGVDLTDLKTKYEAVLDQLPTMDELYRKRLVLRKARGAMDIESNEAKLVMDENGRCIDIVKRDRGTSECMIEEFMLLANQCAANAGRTNKAPFVYRVHEAPDAEKMEKLSATLLACGLNAKFKNPIPTQLELAALLDETRGQPIQIPVHTGILRSMQKARYAPQPLGHYGLVLADYAHFTSPIRRYPDLAIHRILTEMLNGVSASQLQRDFNEFAQQASEKSSKQEVAAVRIERDVEDLYKAEYMHNHLGEVYTGTVAGITPRGVFVELDNTVEGFVPAAQLCKGEPQVIDGVSMLDPLTGKSWMLGSSMKIRVAAADVALGRIDFEYMVE